MPTVETVLDECEDNVLSRASQRCSKVGLNDKFRGSCARSQFVALERIKDSILSDKEVFEKGPSAIGWLKVLVRGQIAGKVVLASSAVDGAVFDYDRCMVRSFPTGQKFDERKIEYTPEKLDYSVAIKTTSRNVSYIEVTRPNGEVELPLLCKDNTILVSQASSEVCRRGGKAIVFRDEARKEGCDSRQLHQEWDS